ncbi:HypC/HybG/HupF family hydrogenase formation chaperone [Synechococcus sp. GreenBA-s]|nr:HypC/HybG/HupF family hydrogenase formation chaperone [Synechococcus sp. GreenBA-s]
MCLAVPGELVSMEAHPDPLWRQGEVSFAGVLRQVSLACVPEARVGDQLLVHAGLALTVLDGDDAELMRQAAAASP